MSIALLLRWAPWLIAALAVGGALVYGSTMSAKVSRAEAEAARVTAQHQELVTASTQEALARSEANRETERVLARNASRIADEHRKQLQALQGAAAGLRADNGRLRDDIARFASGSSEATPGGEPSSAGCEARASTLGDLLAESLRVQEELAGAAEQHLSDARSLWEERQGLTCAP